MLKISTVLAAVLTAAMGFAASASELSDLSKWSFKADPEKSGTMEKVADAPGSICLISQPKGRVSLNGPKVDVKHGTPVKITVNIRKGDYAIIGIYLHTTAGSYISSYTRVIGSAPGGDVTVDFEATDPTKRGFRVGKIVPFIRVMNGKKSVFNSVKVEITAPEKKVDPYATGNALIVRMVPSGYRDDGIGSVYSNGMSMLQLPTWAKNNKFSDPSVKVMLTVPEECKIIHAANFRTPLAADRITREGNVYTFDYGQVHFRDLWKLPELSRWSQMVPLTFTNFEFFIEPIAGKELPARFDIPWQITGTSFPAVSGVMRLRSIPVPKLRGKLDKMVWTGLSAAGEMWNTEIYRKQLKIYAEAGVNGIKDTKSGFTLPEHALPARQVKAEYGITPVMMQMFNCTMRPTFQQLKDKGYAVTEEDLKLNAEGKRETNQYKGKTLQIYCFTAMAEPDSPVRKHMVNEYKKEVARGFEYFFPDYEPDPFNCCWCSKCRKAFAAYAQLDEDKIMAMKPGEVVAAYPLSFWKFANYKIARIFALLNKEVGAKIGWNSCVLSEHVYFEPLKSYGFSGYAEDPRIFDSSVAFHNVDSLMTATRGCAAVEVFLQKKADGSQLLSKPVIARASSLICNNWMYICVLGHRERLEERDFTGIGLDYRRQMQKLEIVGDMALGVDGVEINMNPEAADAAAATGIVEGLQYVVNYQDRIKLQDRRDQRKELRIYDVTTEQSPFVTLGPKGSLGRYIWQFIQLQGVVQGYIHGSGNERLLTLLNWDFYQDKKVRVELDNLPAGGYINVDIDDKTHYTLDRRFDKEFALDIPAGSYAVVAIGSKALYPVRKMPEYKGGKLLPHGLPQIKSNGLEEFTNSLNTFVRWEMRKYPDSGFKLFTPKDWSTRTDDR